MAGLALVLATFAAVAAAAPEDQLVELINARRAETTGCDGAEGRRASPLAPDRRLAGLRVASGGGLPAALERAGYLAARTDYIELGGPGSASEAMRMLERHHCSTITDASHADVGVARDGTRWRIVLARPLLSPNLGDWRSTGREVLRLTNQARATPRRCGERSFDAAPALDWDGKLAQAAHAHSADMARANRFAHRGSDGSQVGDRAARAGYAWQAVGENIAAGQGSARNAVDAWLASPGHCANLMNPRFTEMGAAYVVEPAHDAAIVWTQVFGTPRRKE